MEADTVLVANVDGSPEPEELPAEVFETEARVDKEELAVEALTREDVPSKRLEEVPVTVVDPAAGPEALTEVVWLIVTLTVGSAAVSKLVNTLCVAATASVCPAHTS